MRGARCPSRDGEETQRKANATVKEWVRKRRRVAGKRRARMSSVGGSGAAQGGREVSRGTTGVSRQPTGGIRWWAVLLGWVSAVLAGLIITPVLGVAYRRLFGTWSEGVTVPAVAVALASAFLAYLVGGFVAAKLARYSGGLNGAMTAVIGFVTGATLAAVYAFVGAEPPGTSLATPRDLASSTGLLVVGAALLAVTLAGGYVGGRWGRPDRP